MNANRSRRTAPRLAMLLVTALVAAACGSGLDPTAAPATASRPASTLSPAASATPPGTDIVGAPFVTPVEACAGPREWSGLPAIVIRLADAWHEHDATKRRAILDEVWAEDGLYQDPYGDPTVGRDALADVMGFGVAPGQYLEMRSWDASDFHHDTIRLAWRHCCPSGLSLLEGVEMATLGEDGRFERVISFWSRFVEEPAENACDGPRMSPAAPGASAIADPLAEACRGPEVDWSGVPAVAAGYGRAWNERDAAARRAILEEVWAEHGSYADPTTLAPIVGRAALDEHIGEFLADGNEGYFEPRPIAEGDVHHGFVRFPWVYCDGAGTLVWVGDDFAELDADGRIVRNLGFFAL